VLELLVQ